MCSANGAPTPGLRLRLANDAASDVAFGHAQTLSSSNSYQISELFPFTVEGPPPIRSSSLPFCVRFNQRFRRETPYTLAATLDTGRVANTYPGGIPTR